MKDKTMKTYSIELRRTSFVTLTIEAETKEQAENLAWEEIQDNLSAESNCADWEIGFIDELSADDESRSFGSK